MDGVTEKSGEGASNVKRGGVAIGLRGLKRSYPPLLHVGLRRTSMVSVFSRHFVNVGDRGNVRRRRIAVALGDKATTGHTTNGDH